MSKEKLFEVAEDYRIADVQEKEAKSVKADLRGEYLALMTDVVLDEVPLAILRVFVSDDQDPREFVAKKYPEYTLESVEASPGPTTGYLVTIQENPDLKKYEFVHKGYKYGRTVESAAPTFDAERFYNERKNVIIDTDDGREILLGSLVEKETITVYTLNEAKASALMVEKPEVKDIFEEYVEVGTPKIKLLPIKAIQEED